MNAASCGAGNSQETLGGKAACCAVKRSNLDARMAWKARDTGADLKENFEVGTVSPTLDAETGLWTVQSSKVRGSSHQHLHDCLIPRSSAERKPDVSGSIGLCGHLLERFFCVVDGAPDWALPSGWWGRLWAWEADLFIARVGCRDRARW